MANAESDVAADAFSDVANAESDVAADAFPDVANGAVRDRNSRPCGCATIRSCVRS